MIFSPVTAAKDFSYNAEGEENIARLVCSIIGVQSFSLPNKNKYNPLFDFVIEDYNVQVEIKTSFQTTPYLELYKSNYVPGGVSASGAHLYCFLSKGGTKSNPTGKLRLYPSSLIRTYSYYVLTTTPEQNKFFEGNTFSQSAWCITFDPYSKFLFNKDIWVCDVEFIDNVGYNLSNVERRNGKAAAEFKQLIEEDFKWMVF